MRSMRMREVLGFAVLGAVAACSGRAKEAEYPPDLDETATPQGPPKSGRPPGAATGAPLPSPAGPAGAIDSDAGEFASAHVHGGPPADAAAGAVAAPPGAPGTIAGAVTTDPPRLRKQVVVWLEDGPKDPARGTKATVNQQSMMFTPFVSVVAEGGKVAFVNSDPFPHNVFSPDVDKFDLGQMGKGAGRSHAFTKSGVYRLLCNMHPSMLAYVLVVPSSYFAAAKNDGTFSIEGVPPGTYHVSAWGPHLAKSTQTVTLSGGTVSVQFQLQKGE